MITCPAFLTHNECMIKVGEMYSSGLGLVLGVFSYLASIQRCGTTPRIAPPKKSCSVVGAMVVGFLLQCEMGVVFYSCAELTRYLFLIARYLDDERALLQKPKAWRVSVCHPVLQSESVLFNV